MTVIRWYPSQEVSSFRNSVNRLFDDFLRSPRREDDNLTSTAWIPPVDIYETEHEVVLKAELPEIDEKKVDIQVEGGTLILKGERNLSGETREENYHRIERSYGSFTRSFTLPSNIDSGRISARYRDGVLRVVLPKKEEAKPRQINIEVEKN